MGEDDGEKTTLQIRIDPDRKERWRAAKNERPKYRSMTHLVIASVEAELREEPQVGDVDVDLQGVYDRLDGIQDEIREVADTVDETHVLVRSDEMADYTGLKSLIQELIPSGDRETILKRVPDTPPSKASENELETIIRHTGSASHIVRLLQQEGFNPIEIKGAIEQLADDIKGIEATFARPQDEADKRIYRVD